MSAPDPAVCPMCGTEALVPTDERFDVTEILKRWEAEARVRFDADVWRHYEDPSRREVRLLRCETCAFAPFVPPVVGTAGFYEAIARLEDGYYVGERWEFERALRELREAGAERVLDVGCGSGHFLDALRAAMPEVEAVGFEFNPGVATRARARGHHVLAGPSSSMVGDECPPFDAICLFQVIEHVAEPLRLLKELHRLLAPGGQVIVTVPNAAGPVRHFSSALTDIPPHHVSRWQESTFRLGVPHAAFEVAAVAFEPLPDYLWESYLPVMLERDWLSPSLVRRLGVLPRLPRVLRALRRFGVRRLHGVRGHALYVRLRAASSS